MLTKRNLFLAFLLGLCMAFAMAFYIEKAEARTAWPGLITCTGKFYPPAPLYNTRTGMLSATLIMRCSKPVRTFKAFVSLIVQGKDWPHSEWSTDPRGTAAIQTFPWEDKATVTVRHQCRRSKRAELFRWWGSAYFYWWDGRYTQGGKVQTFTVTLPCV